MMIRSTVGRLPTDHPPTIIMPLHSLYIFDKKGKTLFNKCFVKEKEPADLDLLAEQRKLVFGMRECIIVETTDRHLWSSFPCIN